jgi:hypothetical protein
VGGLGFGGMSSPESDKERTVNPTGPSCFLSSGGAIDVVLVALKPQRQQ